MAKVKGARQTQVGSRVTRAHSSASEAPARVPVVVMGLGFIGQQIAKSAAQSDEVEVIAAIDSSPRLVGRSLSDVVGVPAFGDVSVQSSLKKVRLQPSTVLLHATGSRVPQVMGQLEEAIGLGLHVVSTCEELAFPYLNYPDEAEALDRAAQKKGVCVIGTGVNPGFVLDRLVATMGHVVGAVRHVRAVRVVDARTRREALQRKVGAGMSEDEFFALVERDGLGHVGLVESAALAALGLGLDCDDFEEELMPVFAEENIEGGAFVVKQGQVAGIHQIATGLSDGQERVRLELTIAVGADDPHDAIMIDADTPLRLRIDGGVPGDTATAHTVVHTAPRVTSAQSGLLTVLDLPAGR